MKKILLCCAAGMSTSMLVTKMQQVAKSRDFEIEIWAAAVDDLHENLKKGVNVVLLGPQMKYKLNEVRTACSSYSIPSEVINTLDYGTMNGEKVLNFAFKLIENS